MSSTKSENDELLARNTAQSFESSHATQPAVGSTQMPTDAMAKNFQHPLERAVGNWFVPGNRMEIFQNGCEIFPPMLEAIDNARSSIQFTTYVYWRGDIAQRFAQAFARAAERGVTVKVLLDSHGCQKMSDEYIRLMEQAGVEVRWFRPLSRLDIWNVDNRTHRKVLVCDDETGFTGGVGIADEWDGDARNPDEWRDTHCRIRGPAVLQLRAAFNDNWSEAGEWQSNPTDVDPISYSDGVPLMTVRSDSTVGWTDMATLIRIMIDRAESEILLVSAYFVPDPPLLRLMCDAVARGVTLRILIPGPYTDSRLSQLAGSTAVEELLKAGAEVYKYQKTMLHAKLAVIDRCATLLGSPNLNRRSMGKDEECCVVALSEPLAEQLRERFDADCAEADRLDAATWAKRPLGRRIAEWGANLLIDQL